MPAIKRIFSKSELVSLLFEPILYGWFRPSDTYLYIGCTHAGVVRFQNHDRIGVMEPFADTDEIHFFEADPTRHIFDIERELINQYQPIYNALGKKPNEKGATLICLNPYCKQPFVSKRPWQKFCSKVCRNVRGSIET